MSHLVIMAAGTGGHIIPGLAVARAFQIGRHAAFLERNFAALVAQGIGVWIGVQAMINIGVNMGVLPTKGLTLHS